LRGADAGVNDCDVNSARGESFVSCEEREGRLLNVVRRDIVRDVNYLSFGVDREQRALHCADEIVPRAEVR
jgi:hypothetical protein